MVSTGDFISPGPSSNLATAENRCQIPKNLKNNPKPKICSDSTKVNLSWDNLPLVTLKKNDTLLFIL